MDNNTNFFQNWIDAQTQMTKNWLEVGNKLKDDFSNGKLLNNSDMLNEWMKKSKETFEQWMTNASNLNHANATEANYYEKWLEWQKSSFDNWNKIVQQNWNQMSAAAQQNVNPFFANNQFGNLNDSISQWNNLLTKNFQHIQQFIQNATNKEVFANLLKNNEIYTNLNTMYDNWIQEMKKLSDVKDFQAFINPEHYKQIVDKMFGFDVLENQKKAFAQMQEFWLKNGQNPTELLNQMQNWMNNPTANPFAEFYTTMQKNMNESYAPFLKVLANGKEQEQYDLFMKLSEKLMAYYNKSAELQYHIYNSGYKGLQSLNNEVVEQYKTSKDFASYQEWFQNWISSNEKSFLELFNSDDYSKLQGELLNLELDIRTSYDTITEKMFENFPLILRKDLDEVYLTNYELRKKVRSLDKRIKELENAIKGNVSEVVALEEETTTEAKKVTPTAKAKK